jgi:alpha-mannosidase
MVEPAPSTTPFLEAQPDGASSKRRALFLARELPPVGYRVYRLGQSSPPETEVTVSKDGTTLENANLKVALDATTGVVTSVFDKRSGRESVASGGNANRLEIHWEKPSGMPAWDIGPIAKVDRLDSPVTLQVIETGPLRCTVQFTRQFAKSTLTQRVSLSAGAQQVDFTLLIDWRETGSDHPQWPFLTAAFDLNLDNPVAHFDIPFGSITRPADGQEVPMLKWVDLTSLDGRHGVSLLSDCKHGCSASGSTISLSLVRTPTWPDNTSDNYRQTVRYALYPHQGGPNVAGTAFRAYALVSPVVAQAVGANAEGELPPECSFVSPGDGRALITAVKRAEDDNDLVVRLYESAGAATKTRLTTYWPATAARAVNFIEDPLKQGPAMRPVSGSVPLSLRPWEVRTIKLRLRDVRGVKMTGTRGPGPVRQF